jgi:archaeal type IV pilus assembly protein PilA
MHQKNFRNEMAVSGVVGEMLITAIVLILVAVFSASLANYLPSEHSPSVTIMMSNDTAGNLVLWHKGGDWVKAGSLRVIVSETNGIVTTYSLIGDDRFILVPDTQAFDLESNITVNRNTPLFGNESISLATDRAVIFSGTSGSSAP